MAGRRPASRRGSSRGASSFGSFLAGLTLGLVVALVVYLNPRPDQLLARRSPETSESEAHSASKASPKKDPERRTSEKSGRERDAKYDFYSILPETEDQTAAHRAPSRRANTAAKPPPAERKETPSRPPVASAERAPAGASQSDPQANAPKTQAPAEPVAKLDPDAPASRPQSPPPVAKAPSSYAAYYLQVGAFRQLAEAEKTRAQLALLGVSGKVQRSSVAGQEIYRVRVGPFRGADAAQEARQRLSENGVRYVVVGDRRAYSDESRQP
jgi:cell division protein FtsN